MARLALPSFVHSMNGEGRHGVVLIVATAAYVALATVGLSMEMPAPFVTPVWPASGFALGLLVGYGPVYWPVAAGGSLVTCLWWGMPLPGSLGMAMAATVEAVLGWYLLTRVVPIRRPLDRLRDVAWFVILGSKAATLVGAALTTIVLCVAGVMPWADFWTNGLLIWLGHALGVIVVGTLVTISSEQADGGLSARRWGEAALIGVLLLLATALVFASPLRFETYFPKWTYLVFPFVLWAAARLGTPGAAAACLLVAAVAVAGTERGLGPFGANPPPLGILSLQAFIAVLALSGLTLGASVEEREEARRAADHARRVAEAANQSKSLFLASASHDLRQPLNALSLFHGVLSARPHGLEEATLLGKMRDALDALVEMFNGLLDVSKLELGVTEVVHGTFPLQSVFDRLESEYTGVAEGKGVALRVVPCSLVVRSEPVLLERILRNFVANAIIHAPITRTQGGRVLIGARRWRDQLRIDVIDNGVGFDPELKDRLFDELYQIGNPERRRAKGHGLGLAIVKKAAGLLGHPLDVASVPGRGARFSILVPVAGRTRKRRAMAAKRVQDVPALNCTVLVVEDAPGVMSAMETALTSLGCTVLEAGCGRSALDLLEDGLRPDVVIADYRLPGDLDGIETVARIRRLIGPVPACVISGDVAKPIRDQATREVGAFFSKPIRPNELHKFLERACAGNCD
ncbi:MASE1 domain-containing protein [Azospirillum rugosum]|uniref:histidine kinase n=1 Tax=Azospirillum rugosum TaxID=416170 RepID=A0ABS4SMN9_9PROT|nr:MASE1 domain-containing protein [Azospirillum rugosum]MBP2293757.1 signal transduction histidine kinase/CheY-like chemotaxis protein [Azospirillum rugosum]MDQ0527302.1 signal transduction histidine kinase/CheY-like chemotaxis protein [Azospirillum rugosum]